MYKVDCYAMYSEELAPLYPTRNAPTHRLNMELDLQSLFGLHVHSSLADTTQPPPSSRIWAHIRERYTVKKRLPTFPSPAGMSLTKLSLELVW